MRILRAQSSEHLLPSVTFRITPHMGLEPQLQIQRDRRQTIGLRVKTSFSTSCLLRDLEHTGYQSSSQAFTTPPPLSGNPTQPTTLWSFRMYLQRSRRNQPPLCCDYQRRPYRLVVEQLMLSTGRIPMLSWIGAPQ